MMVYAPKEHASTQKSRRRASKFGRFRDVPKVLEADDQRNDSPITHEELAEKLRTGSRVLNCLIETIPATGDGEPLYLLFLSCNFRPRGYRIYRVRQYERPRFFRNMNRLLALVRNDYFYDGPIEIIIRKEKTEATRSGDKAASPRRESEEQHGDNEP